MITANLLSDQNQMFIGYYRLIGTQVNSSGTMRMHLVGTTHYSKRRALLFNDA